MVFFNRFCHLGAIAIDSIALAIPVLGVGFGTAFLIAWRSRFYRNALAEQEAGRYGTIDGLRGLLPLCVFLSHGVTSYSWYEIGRWSWPHSAFYSLCGSLPVSLFFMVTGFLFWRKAAAAPGRMDLKALYGSRLRRLAPLYLACLGVILAIVVIRTGWRLNVPPVELVTSVAAWLSFGLAGFPDINELRDSRVIDPALWTLRFEWMFYLALPPLSFFATPRRFAGIVSAGAALSLLGLAKPFDVVVANFLIGMGAAQFTAARAVPAILRSRGAAVLAILPAVANGIASDGDFSVVESLSLMPLFYLVVAGNDFFGALSTRALRLLGLVSYSTYVLHGVVLYVALALLNQVSPIAGMAPIPYWTVLLLLAIAVVAISAGSYRWIEHPFLSLPRQRLGKLHALPVGEVGSVLE